MHSVRILLFHWPAIAGLKVGREGLRIGTPSHNKMFWYSSSFFCVGAEASFDASSANEDAFASKEGANVPH